MEYYDRAPNEANEGFLGRNLLIWATSWKSIDLHTIDPKCGKLHAQYQSRENEAQKLSESAVEGLKGKLNRELSQYSTDLAIIISRGGFNRRAGVRWRFLSQSDFYSQRRFEGGTRVERKAYLNSEINSYTSDVLRSRRCRLMN